MTHQRWVGTIEYIGPLDRKDVLGAAHGLPARCHKGWTFWRPIRFLARMHVMYHDCSRAPTRQEIEKLSGVPWCPQQGGHEYVSEATFSAIYNAIPWDWALQPSVR